jgi:hypothetical protein
MQLGTDDLFHKRKAKKVNDLNRKQAAKRTYEKILIVCEGSKTEPNYFAEAIDHYELHTANVSISGKCGSAPISVFDHGLALYNQEKKDLPKAPFDRVFFVFDRDQHETYDEAMRKIRALKQKDTFFAITSVPSFEFWLLLHFERTTRPFIATGRLSSGAAVLKALEVHMPDYVKGRHGTFKHLKTRLDGAKTNADLVNAHAKKNQTDNPTTLVHELIDFMENMKPG